MGARTDVRWLCQGCATRFAGVNCPSCGKSADSRSGAMPILDLAREADRGALRELLAKREEARDSPAISGGNVVTGALFVLAICLAGSSFIAALVVVIFAFALDMGRRLRKRGALQGTIGVGAPALPVASEDRVVRSGKVHCEAPLISPISGQPCVAFRVAGTFGPFLIDDAAVAPFVLVSAKGDTMVLPGSALVELEAPRPSELRVSPKLEDFFGSLGISVQRGDAVELGESLLHEGDYAEVEGHLDLSGAGYRGSSGDVLAGRTDSPMLIRVAP